MITRSNHMAGRPRSTQSRLVLAFIVTAAVVAYACESSPTPPTPPANGGTAPGTTGGSSKISVKPGVTTLCKFGPGGTFVVRVGVTDANATTKTVAVDAGQCADVATVDPASKDDVIVAIAENPVAFTALDHIVMQHGAEPERSMTRTNVVSFEGSHGAVVSYFNNAVVTLCKAGLSGTFQYQAGLTDGFHDLSLAGGQCSTIAVVAPASADDVIVTVRENTSASYRLDHVTLVIGDLAPRTVTGATSVSFEGVHGGVVTFTNVAP